MNVIISCQNQIASSYSLWFPSISTSCRNHRHRNIPGALSGTYLMKPVSDVITSPGTTRSFRSKVESDTCFRISGNLMSAAMLLTMVPLLLLLLPPPSLTDAKQVYALYCHLWIHKISAKYLLHLSFLQSKWVHVLTSPSYNAHTNMLDYSSLSWTCSNNHGLLCTHILNNRRWRNNSTKFMLCSVDLNFD